ncbi:MAG: aminotransferase class IV [Cellulomonadaceae bacterium]
MTVLWFDGQLRDADEPLVGSLDHGITVGDGVFETCSIQRGEAFALTRHLRRLARSAKGLGLPAPDDELIRAATAEVLAEVARLRSLEEDSAPFWRLRITHTAGIGPLGSGRMDSTPTLIVAASPADPHPVSRVVRVPWTRNEHSAVAGLKTTSYAENVVALARATARGADEALLANTVGDLCEGTGSNVFLERDGELLTPPLSSGCLAGITRELTLEWSAAAGLPVREAAPGELRYSDLDDVTAGRAHLMLTGSVRNAVPVVTLDDVEVAPGPITEAACELFAQRLSADLDP